jgi:uncharacterized surface protein with fasciclin (FAS1) repeats
VIQCSAKRPNRERSRLAGVPAPLGKGPCVLGLAARGTARDKAPYKNTIRRFLPVITRRSLLLTASTAALLSACTAGDDIRADGSRPLLTLMEAQPELSDFRRALGRAGLDTMLAGDGPFTVFAPTNTAFAQGPQAMRDGNADALRNLITNSRLSVASIQARQGRIRMAGGVEIRVVGGTPQQPRIQAAREGGVPSGASASITRPNLLARNGMIHVVDAVLVPAA